MTSPTPSSRTATPTKPIFQEEIVTRPAKAEKTTKLVRKYDVAEVSKGGKRTVFPYQGKTVTIEKKGDKYTFTVGGKELTGDDVEELQSEFNKHEDIPLEDRDLLPVKPVKVGETWAVSTEKVMKAFAAAELKVLVSTTVVEVGVNVPNASLIIIHDAERFGLAQLHQLRGRVGRGADQSYCILIGDPKSDVGKLRLKTMTDLPIQVDGGITAETAPLMVEAGARVLVAGSAVYKGEPEKEMRSILEAGRRAVKETR